MAEDVDEEHRLDALDGALMAEQRDDDIAADVRQHAPEQCVRQAVEAIQPEQGVRPQQLDAEGTLLDEAGRQPAGPREGRQQQRSEEHTSELQSLMRISYAVFC